MNDGAGKGNANRTSEKRSTRPGNARETANEISNANEPASRKMTARTARTARRPARRLARPSRRARRLFASRTRLRSTQTAPRARRMSISSSDTEASPALGSTRAKKGLGSRARARARARAPARGWSGGVRRVRFVGGATVAGAAMGAAVTGSTRTFDGGDFGSERVRLARGSRARRRGRGGARGVVALAAEVNLVTPGGDLTHHRRAGDVLALERRARDGRVATVARVPTLASHARGAGKRGASSASSGTTVRLPRGGKGRRRDARSARRARARRAARPPRGPPGGGPAPSSATWVPRGGQLS